MKHLFLIFALACTIPLAAQELSLSEALFLAEENSSTAKNATLELEKQYNETQVNTYLPSLNLSVGGSASGSIMDASYSASISPSIGLSFSLSNADKYSNEQSDLLYQAAQNTYTSTMNTLASQVTSAYWNVVAAGYALEIQELDLKNKEQSLQSMKEKYEGGLATTLAVSQAELSLSNSRLSLQQKTQALASAQQSLAKLTGVTVDGTSDELITPQELVSLDTLDNLAMGTTSIESLGLSVQSAELSYAQSKHASFSPSMSLSASTDFSGTLSTMTSQLKDNTSVSVSFSLPLDSYFPSSQAQITLENLEKSIEIANNTQQSGIEDFLSSIESAYTALEQAEATLQYLEEYKAVAENNLQLTQSAWEAGEVSYAALEEIESAVSNASLAILQQQVSYTLALYDLSHLLETDIETLFL